MSDNDRVLSMGAQTVPEGVFFRVWAPDHQTVEVVIEQGDESKSEHPLARDERGYFSGLVPGTGAGTLYRYRVDGAGPYPDPCSRFQPEGPHRPSMVVDPCHYRWQDDDRQGVAIKGQVIYEMHIGTFTSEGTFDAAIRHLPSLKEVGVTVLEVMPVAEWAGRWNWGYDGVNLYAPTHNYGDPEAFKRFVDAAHGLGLGVILDVVYNHLGPDGNYLACFAGDYFTDTRETDWGAAINYDGPNSHEVREYFVQNACYWITEFHLDGLRLDATQNIYDSSEPHILAELSQRVREAALPRDIILVGENEPQQVINLRPVSEGGYGLDALWNDDFHHSSRVALTGRHEGYYHDYRGTPQEFISAIRRGFLYQGQFYSWQDQPRGTTVSDEPATAFVVFNQNHDQVGNTLFGDRLLSMTSWSRYKALTALMLLSPETPMLFMGQEFGASSPFLFFVDHNEDLQEPVYSGRKEFLTQFRSFASPEAQAQVPDPSDPGTFYRCKLDQSERGKHAYISDFHADLLRIRREDPVIAAQDRGAIEGAVLSPGAFVLRYFSEQHGDRLLVANMGQDLEYSPAPVPLLAAPAGMRWELAWTSDHPRYRGWGVAQPSGPKGWEFPGECTVLMRLAPEEHHPPYRPYRRRLSIARRTS